jgi:hypothetical protein
MQLPSLRLWLLFFLFPNQILLEIILSGTIVKGEFLADSTELEWQWQKMLAGTFGSENRRKRNKNFINYESFSPYCLLFILCIN